MKSIDKGKFCYEYPHAALTADCVIFGFDGHSLNVLLVERGVEPHKGMWALPGGFMRMDETVDQCARRELAEETNLRNVYLEQFRVYSDVDRDPRERVVTVAFIALVRPSDYRIVAGDDAAQVLWFDESALPPLAFDHDRIIRQAREHLAEVIRIRPIAFKLLDETFKASELQRVYEVINRTTYDRRNFMRKAMQSGAITEATDVGDAPEVDGGAPSVCCEAAPAPAVGKGAAPALRSRRSKLFSFRGLKKGRADADDASMKDIFNF